MRIVENLCCKILRRFAPQDDNPVNLRAGTDNPSGFAALNHLPLHRGGEGCAAFHAE